jgi:cAMP phosphodiesterase
MCNFFSVGERDPKDSYNLYVSKRPFTSSADNHPDYLAKRTIPLGNEWMKTPQKVGDRKLSSVMQEMAPKASFTDKKLTSHSARKYLVQQTSGSECTTNRYHEDQ